jgi:YgiT-type zinc finger domain-containing protein
MTHMGIGLPIDKIRDLTKKARYHISEHVMRTLMARDVTIQDIERTIHEGKILEMHRHPSRNESYLLLGDFETKPVHVIVTEEVLDWFIVLFAYRPAFPIWADSRNRRIDIYGGRKLSMKKCFFCGGELENILVGNFDYRLEGKLYVIKKVPASLCLNCGEKYVSGETAKKIDWQISAGNFLGTEEVLVMEFG